MSDSKSDEGKVSNPDARPRWPKGGACEWRRDALDWVSACGHSEHGYFGQTPMKTLGWTWCPYCGGRIEEVEE